MTLDSEVDTRSTDRPWRLKIAKASARNPGVCHMATLSMLISVMFSRLTTPLTCASSRAGRFPMRPRDVVYVSTNGLTKFSRIVDKIFPYLRGAAVIDDLIN